MHFIINVLYRAIITHWCALHTHTHTCTQVFIATNTRIHILHALMHRLKRISTAVNMNFTTEITVMKSHTRKTISTFRTSIWYTHTYTHIRSLALLLTRYSSHLHLQIPNIVSSIPKDACICFVSFSVLWRLKVFARNYCVNKRILMSRNLFHKHNWMSLYST